MRLTRPFCAAPQAARRFDEWLKRLAAAGVALGGADRHLLGLLASREANLEVLQSALAALYKRKPPPGVDELAKLMVAEDRAARGMARALADAERVFGPRAQPDQTGKLAPPRGAARGGGEHGATLRIVAALARGPMTKAELREAAPGRHQPFLAGLKQLLKEGRIEARGPGKAGRPKRYYLIGGAR